MASQPPEEGREESNKQRQSNLQRIQQGKQSVMEWPVDKKLEKLAMYSSCKADATCKCNGWKNPDPPANPPRPEAPTPTSRPSLVTMLLVCTDDLYYKREADWVGHKFRSHPLCTLCLVGCVG